MINHYHILGIDQNANIDEIRKAYKKLALKYHPDKNSGNKVSEEKFKLVNEAYQVLSDAAKRNRHDIELNYSKRKSEIFQTQNNPTRNEKSVYNRYGKYDWRNAPRYTKAPTYRIDKHYYRNIIISFFAMLLLAALALGINNYHNYLKEQEKIAIEKQYSQALQAAQNLYDAKKYQEALTSIEELVRKYPIEYRFFEKKESFIENLNDKAIKEYNRQQFSSALSTFTILSDYQKPVRLSNWQLMADCYSQLQDYKNAARMYEMILERDHENLQLMLKVAGIYRELGNSKKALDYYNEARYTFKKFQEAAYGAAYEFVIDPAELPEEYFHMFLTRAELLVGQGSFAQAIKDYNWAIFIQPNNAELYYLRAKSKFALGQDERCCNDIFRALESGFAKEEIKIKVNCPFL